jgi:hypothetical protein
MIAAFHRDEHRDAKADLVLIDQRHAAQDDALGLHALDALPARGRRKSDPVADFGYRQGGVILQNGEDFAIYSVKAARSIKNCYGEVRH